MSALNAKETAAMFTAIGVTATQPGCRPTSDDLVRLLRRLEALCECGGCGCFFRPLVEATDHSTCPACAELVEHDAQAERDAAADRYEAIDQISMGGYPRV